MTKDPAEISNFDRLCELLKKSDCDPENIGIIYEMMALEGYEDWLAWMEEHRPDDLP